MALVEGYEGLNTKPQSRWMPTLAPTRPGRSSPSRCGTRPWNWARRTATATHRRPSSRPTGTIGLVMDCDTTGIEPDFALVKFKKLAGGGYFKIINRSGAGSAGKRSAMTMTGQIDAIDWHMRLAGHAGRRTRTSTDEKLWPLKGFGPDEFAMRRGALPSAFDIRFVFNQWTLGEGRFCEETLGLDRGG